MSKINIILVALSILLTSQLAIIMWDRSLTEFAKNILNKIGIICSIICVVNGFIYFYYG